MSCGISSSFPEVFPTSGQVTHVLLTRPPLDSGSCPPGLARLACVKHAASVHSEPGSNSPLKSVLTARTFRARSDRCELNPVFLRKQFLVLRENQRKIDVWHALLSFQGTAPRACAPKPRRTAGAKQERTSALRRTFQLTKSWRASSIQSAGAAARKDATAHAGGGPWKDPTLAGNGNIGPP